MKRIFLQKTLVWLIAVVFLPIATMAQVTITGTVLDGDLNEEMVGATISIKDQLIGTVTDFDGTYSLTTDFPTPFTLVVSFIGFESQEFEITQSQTLDVTMQSGSIMSNEVVISASRVEERLIESPVTIEKLDPIAIKASSSADYYDAIANLKGVQSTTGSMTITTINTRGFNSISNVRFVQLMDGMDNAAPLLNFPTGNIVGIGELDIHSVELIPGPSSALYGANAFNGILLMNSKNPFDYQGSSFQAKMGAMASDGDRNPYGTVAYRYANSIGKSNKVAFKMNIAYQRSSDWLADDYYTGRKTENISDPDGPGEDAFDGLNTIGDETQIGPVPSSFYAPLLAPALAEQAGLLGVLAPAGTDLSEEGIEAILKNLPTLDLRRTGFKEIDLLESRDASSFKVDGAIHYRPNDKLDLSYAYRRGSGDGVYQGAERYALRGLSQQFHKLELSGDEFFVRAYLSQTNDGDSYNLAALGGLVNEAIIPTAPRNPTDHPGIDPSLYGTSWLTHYLGAYGLLAMLGSDFTGNISDKAQLDAERIARQVADGRLTNQDDKFQYDLLSGLVRGDEEGINVVPDPESEEFKAIVEKVRKANLPNGGGFIDNSRMYHTEFNYNFKNLFDFMELQVGGNWRQYDLFTDGTVFLEDADGDGINERIHINEYGGYVQIGKKFIDDRLKIQASARYDKNQNFKGQISPRVSVVYSGGERRQHNIRASFQTGFRNPTTQDQFIFFPSSSGNILGSVKDNAEQFGIHNGGAYTAASASAALNARDPSLLKEINLEYVQPEKMKAMEIGYKGSPHRKLLLDVNGYFNIYNDFIVEQTVAAKNAVTVGGVFYQGVDDIFRDTDDEDPNNTAALFRPSFNASTNIFSYGVGLGLSYNLPRKMRINASYNLDDFFFDEDKASEDFSPQFNTPLHKWQINWGTQGIQRHPNFGFDISYRWNAETVYEASYAVGTLPAYGVLAGQVSYKIPQVRSIVKLGVQNILGQEYQSVIGGPRVGSLYYVGWTFDEAMPVGSDHRSSIRKEKRKQKKEAGESGEEVGFVLSMK